MRADSVCVKENSHGSLRDAHIHFLLDVFILYDYKFERVWKKTKPHDHKIGWDNPDEHPEFGPAINYFDGNIPEFKSKHGGICDIMKITDNRLKNDYFKTISDFKDCMQFHGEVVLEWHSEQYGIFWDGSRYCIAKIDGSYEKWCNSADEVLKYIVGKDRLRDVITKVTVIDRTI